MRLEQHTDAHDTNSTHSNADDSRGALRTQMQVPVVVHNHHAHDGLLTNMSSSGAFVTLAHPLQPGEVVEVEFSAPDGTRSLRLLGEVRWRQEDDRAADDNCGVGIEFRNLGDEGLEHLLAILESHDKSYDIAL